MSAKYIMTIEDDPSTESSLENTPQNDTEELVPNSNFFFAADTPLISNRSSSVVENIRHLLKNKQSVQKSTDDIIKSHRVENAVDRVLSCGNEDEQQTDEMERTLNVEDFSNVSDDDEANQDKIREKKRKEDYFSTAEEEVSHEEQVLSFNQMSLSRPLMKALNDMGYVKPTKIQSLTIPRALMGRDICGSASTGSGKTAAFLLPVLERLLYKPKNTPATRVLVLTPTRELAAQAHSVAINLSKYSDITSSLCVGGMSNQQQEIELKNRPDILIATPGRLIDHVKNSASFTLDQIEILILDEADRMLEEGFQAEMQEIIKACPRSRQTLLFSATMTDDVDKMIRLSLNKPIRLFLDPSSSVAMNLVQEFIRVRYTSESKEAMDKESKSAPEEVDFRTREAILMALCQRTYKHRVIIFFPSKLLCHRMKIIFGLCGLNAAELHGNLTQLQRLQALDDFKESKVDFLLATDLAARGLDIVGVETVINFSMPTQYERYVHRVGRTARNERSGKSVTLIGEHERKMLKTVFKNLRPGQQLNQRTIPVMILKKCSQQIQSLDETVKSVIREEKEEREFKQAEMELNKAENMTKYEKEILSRPAKKWFQSQQQKNIEKKKEKASEQIMKDAVIEGNSLRKEIQNMVETSMKRGENEGLNRKQRRKRQLEKEAGGKEELKKSEKMQKIAARQFKKSNKKAPVTKQTIKSSKKNRVTTR